MRKVKKDGGVEVTLLRNAKWSDWRYSQQTGRWQKEVLQLIVSDNTISGKQIWN